MAIDFSLDRLDVALQAPEGDWVVPHHAYSNNWAGYQALKQDVLAYLQSPAGAASLTAVGEATGVYWWHAFYHLATDADLAPYQPQLALLNPMHVKYYRKALPQQDKDDASDPQLIGRYFRDHGVKHACVPETRYRSLRQLSRAYRRLVHNLASEKAFGGTLVYLLASEYPRVRAFYNIWGATSRQLLSEYPDLDALAAIPVDDLAAVLQQATGGRLRQAPTTAAQLQQVAADSYPLATELQPAVHTCLQYTLTHIDFLEKQKQAYTQLLQAQLASFPEAELLLAEPGLGPILTAGLLGEIGDTRRFLSGRKYDRRRHCWRDRTYRDGQASVARLAGLWWPRHSSGRFDGQVAHLARERNTYLRYWFVQAAQSLKGHQEAYAAYYWKKYHEVPRFKHKRALILTARKVVRLVFALLHKGQMRQLEEAATA